MAVIITTDHWTVYISFEHILCMQEIPCVIVFKLYQQRIGWY